MNNKPMYVLAKVLKPKYEPEKNKLLVPLVAVPDTIMMEATICYYMIKHGYSMSEIREIRRHIPKQWTKEAVISHVERNGEAEYPKDWYGPMRRNKK
jgi:hypothetical protein